MGDEDADSPLPFFRWMKKHIPRQRATFRSANQRIRSKATVAGLGLVFKPEHEAKLYPDLVQVLDPRPD